MSDFALWLLVHLPWWVDALVGLAIVGAVSWYIPPLRHWMWEAALVVAVIAGAAALAQKGYGQKAAEDMTEGNKAIDRSLDARRKQQEINRDPKNLRKPDPDMRND